MTVPPFFPFFFFFNDTATTEIYTLSLHDALPICKRLPGRRAAACRDMAVRKARHGSRSPRDRKSTRLNSSHSQISYAVFCLKKKKHADGLLPAGRLTPPRTASRAERDTDHRACPA